MRYYIKCDICNREFFCKGMKLPKEVMLNYGMDMCNSCRKEHNKRLNKLTKDLQKERFNKLQYAGVGK